MPVNCYLTKWFQINQCAMIVNTIPNRQGELLSLSQVNLEALLFGKTWARTCSVQKLF